MKTIACVLLAGLNVSSMGAQVREPLALWYEQPAQQWVEAVPIGNGGFGAMVFGGTETERLQFNDDTLFSGEPHDYAHPGAVTHLPELRNLLFEGKQKAAHELGNRAFMSVSTSGSNRQEAYQPFGDLTLSFSGHASATDYRRDLNLNDATASVRYVVDGVTYTREVFASYPDQAIVLRVLADQPGHLSFVAGLSSSHQDVATHTQADNLLILSGQVENGKTRFEARLRVRVTGGTSTTTQTGIAIENADSATLILVGASSFVNFRDISADPAVRCAGKLKAIGDKRFATLRQRHVMDYQELFKRCTLDLGGTGKVTQPTDKRIEQFGPNDPQLATLFFQYGRYLLIACSRPGSQPATLQGLWNQQKRPPWDSKYTININTEMNYWPAEITGLPECHQPLIDALDDLVESGTRVARQHYGARGWVVHHNFDLWRGAAPINNANHGIWVTGGAWLCQHLWWHYEFGRDRDYLENTAYPMMKSAALFFMDYLVEDPRSDSGRLISGPSNSPEQGGLVMGPTMDHQIIRDLLGNVIAAARILEVDDAFRKQCADLRQRIAPNQIGKHGQLQEWVEDRDDPANHHRHLSHMWGLYPGTEITVEDTPRLAGAVAVSLEQRGDGPVGWSRAWQVGLYARLMDAENAYDRFAKLISLNANPNFFNKCFDDRSEPFQIDANFGATAGLAEMLLQRRGSDIHLLPALPSAFPAGRVNGLRAPGGIDVDMVWTNGALTSSTIRSRVETDCVVRYNRKRRSLHVMPGQRVTLRGEDLH